MTDNQRKAIDELSLYREAKKDLRHMALQIEAHEAKVHKTTKSCDSIMRETWRDGRFIAVPVVVQTSHGGNAVEELMDALMDQRVHLIQKQAEAERICMMIEINISDRCEGVDARILRDIFIEGHRLELIAVNVQYCYAHIKRIKWRALERYGEKMRGLG